MRFKLITVVRIMWTTSRKGIWLIFQNHGGEFRLAATLASPETDTDVPRKSYLFFLMHITTWNRLVLR